MEMFDLRMCSTHQDGRAKDWLRSLSEIVIDILAPEKTFGFEARGQLESMWETVARGTFVDNDNSREDNLSYTGIDDEEGRRRRLNFK